MLTLKDSEDLFDLEFHTVGSKKRKFIERIELLAEEADNALVQKTIAKAQKIFGFVDYLFTHGGQYIQLALVDHFFKKLKKMQCKLLYVEQNETKEKTGKAMLKICYRMLFSDKEHQLTLITIRNQ